MSCIFEVYRYMYIMFKNNKKTQWIFKLNFRNKINMGRRLVSYICIHVEVCMNFLCIRLHLHTVRTYSIFVVFFEKIYLRITESVRLLKKQLTFFCANLFFTRRECAVLCCWISLYMYTMGTEWLRVSVYFHEYINTILCTFIYKF